MVAKNYTMCYYNTVMPHTETLGNGEGSYAHDYAAGRVDSGHVTDDIHDGNIGFHHETTLHDEAVGHLDEATGRMPDEATEWEGAPDVRIVDEKTLIGAAARRTRRSKAEIDPDTTDADEWLQLHDPTWKG